jgi:hypothetical protein
MAYEAKFAGFHPVGNIAIDLLIWFGPRSDRHSSRKHCR